MPAWIALRVTAIAVTAALLGSLAACGGSDEPSSPSPLLLPPDTPVVLIVIDTLRADHLGCYGYPLDTSPVLDDFASRAYQFNAHSTQVNVTFASLTSILTGLYSKTHSIYLSSPMESDSGEAAPEEGAPADDPPSIHAHVNLAERLAPRGYHNIAVVSHPLWRRSGDLELANRGWDAMSIIGGDIPVRERKAHARQWYTNERLFPLLDAAPDQPLFLWAHYFDPHTDLRGLIYDPPEALRNRYLEHHLAEAGQSEWLEPLRDLDPTQRHERIYAIEDIDEAEAVALANGKALYDAEIRSCDEGLGALFDKLRALSLYDRAFIAVLADHGENLEPRSAGHDVGAFTHKRLFEAVVHTPLLVKLPHQSEPVSIDAMTQNIDLVPTLIELLGLPTEPAVEGRSLVPLMDGSQRAVHERVFAESSDGVEKAVKSEQVKYIYTGPERDPLVYLWRSDPGELAERFASLQPDQVEPLEDSLNAFTPLRTLRIRLAPMDEPYKASVRVDLGHGRFESTVGTPAPKLGDDGHKAVWSGRVVKDPVDLMLMRPSGLTEVRVRITHDGVERLGGRLDEWVYLGNTAVGVSTALPLWSPTDGAPPEHPQLSLTTGDDTTTLALAVDGRGVEEVVAEFLYADANWKADFEVLTRSGFSRPQLGFRRVFRATARNRDEANLALKKTSVESPVYTLVRLDGRWPDPRRIALDGQPVAHDVLEFVLPTPEDRRLNALLRSAPRELPPGAIALWESFGVEQGEIDTERLNPEVVEQLRELGYLR